MTDIADRLDRIHADGSYRRARLVSGPQGPRAVVDGNPCLVLCSDNYLGLADHPRVRQAAAEAVERWGGGSGGSRQACGYMGLHRRLERRLADFMGFESTLLQGPAQMAVASSIAALAGPGDVIFSDQLNGPGIVAGCRLSGAEVVSYEHGDARHLAWAMERAEGRGALIVTESVFAAEGDRAPLLDLADLAHEHDCRFLVEESHAVGAIGPEGRGLVAAAGLTGEVDLIVASLGKALASYGSFVACDSEMADYLSNATASVLCSTAPPPASVAAALAALELVQEHPYRVERLRLNAICLREALAEEGVRAGGGEGQIVTVPAGGAWSLAEAGERALAQGVLVGALNPLELPGGEAAMRLSVMATHRAPELRAAAQVVAAASRGAGIPAAAPLRVVTEDWTDGEGWVQAPAREQELPAWIRAA